MSTFPENKEFLITTTMDNKNFITYQHTADSMNTKKKGIKLSISQPALTDHETCLRGCCEYPYYLHYEVLWSFSAM
jgi:hypothetical protein